MKKIVLIAAALITLAGCSSGGSKEEITKNDMCVIQIDTKSKVCYGDTKEDVEKIVGNGSQGFAKTVLDYDFGLSVMYRDDAVAGVVLDEESKDVYKTGRGSMIGDSKVELKKDYSEKYAIELAERNLDYFYDKEGKSFLGEESIKSPEKQEIEDYENVYVVSFMFDDDGNTNRVMLLDRRMATRMD